ncbi:hypothetical protein [Rhodovulum sp. FJ3]|uniref:hypothetical protein n=1 Tax=Rhodovulum sp. FJ3 TaxID=3079053 RepID=UPI00293DCAFE|nr:hypothetical protein [Rhodovulum sp. FJ3]MDV4168377.1 hypothetical protein [Rhodovulum sp. FJ3]
MSDPEWFLKLTGFDEAGYAETQRRLKLQGSVLYSSEGKRIGHVGQFRMVPLFNLRKRLGDLSTGQIDFGDIAGESGALHRDHDNAGSTMQVASQFNCLEMLGPDITPEHGVTQYAYDRTQGPVCAIAAGAGTIWRNYLIPMGQRTGQTRKHQLDGAACLGALISGAMKYPGSAPWRMKNGYLLPSEKELRLIKDLLEGMSEEGLDKLRGELSVGMQVGVEIDCPTQHRLTQVFCSAVPVSYSGLDPDLWEPLARLVLEASYEATLIAAAMNARHTANPNCFLTMLGGGAFGNRTIWIEQAIERALEICGRLDLRVRLVHYAGGI